MTKKMRAYAGLSWFELILDGLRSLVKKKKIGRIFSGVINKYFHKMCIDTLISVLKCSLKENFPVLKMS